MPPCSGPVAHLESRLLKTTTLGNLIEEPACFAVRQRDVAKHTSSYYLMPEGGMEIPLTCLAHERVLAHVDRGDLGKKEEEDR